MKRKRFIHYAILMLLLPSMFISSCKETEQQMAGEKVQTYTCPMHPQIVQTTPGSCPICGMDLVHFDKTNTDPSLTLSENQQALANITTTTVSLSALSDYTQLNGRLAIDPEQTVFISSRVPGRIEQLYVRETGVKVSKGQPLYKIYSEQLASLQQEYLLATAQAEKFPDDKIFQQIAQTARQKLLLYDQSEKQLQVLINRQQTDPFVTYPSPASGIVAELLVTEGQYVVEGGPVMRVEGYNHLWVEADVYPSEAGSVKEGQQVKVVIPGWEDQEQDMRISFITPALQSGSQLMKVRGSIPNINNQWQSGLQANVLLPAKSKGKVISLPVDAVIRDGNGSHVWVETEKGKFEPRMVETGMENFDKVEITEGLDEGDNVVITGAYLLYSEYILKKGKNPMAGHNHGNM